MTAQFDNQNDSLKGKSEIYQNLCQPKGTVFPELVDTMTSKRRDNIEIQAYLKFLREQRWSLKSRQAARRGKDGAPGTNRISRGNENQRTEEKADEKEHSEQKGATTKDYGATG